MLKLVHTRYSLFCFIVEDKNISLLWKSYSHQGIGIVKRYWDFHLLCNNKKIPMTNRTVTYHLCLEHLDFNVVSSTGWRSNELQVEFIWIFLENILSKQVEL
jgi:hypothetical protein